MNYILYQLRQTRLPIRTESKNLACVAFYLISFACGTFFFHSKSGLRCMIFIKYVLFNHSGMYLIWSFLFCLPIHWWWKRSSSSREVFKRSASVDIIWVTVRDRDSEEQTTWIKQSLPQRYVCVGCQLNSDQALRLICLKGHVRARDSTLWRHRLQKASEFYTPLFLQGVEQPKPRQKKPGNALSHALIKSRFPNFAADNTKKKSAPRSFLKLRFARFWLMNQFEIRWGQRFWDILFFTGTWPSQGRHKTVLESLLSPVSCLTCQSYPGKHYLS